MLGFMPTIATHPAPKSMIEAKHRAMIIGGEFKLYCGGHKT
jgi:hypothetical protein